MNARKINGYQETVEEWNLPFSLVEKEEGGTKFLMVEGEVYEAPAFFNPVMVMNRDLTILFTRLLSRRLQKEVRVFEPLAGIGVRALRMVNEIPEYIQEILINDLGDVSSELARYNRHITSSGGTIHQFKREARDLATELAFRRFKFHIIDLDPFGPPVPFLDSLWTVTLRGGLISVTATDMQALAGVHPDACMRKYGGRPLNNHHTHETACRILIATVVQSAARFERGVVPIFSVSDHHYVKVFFLVSEGRGVANKAVSQVGLGGTCRSCQAFKLFKYGETFECCGEVDIYGPLWTGELGDKEWCQVALEENEEMNLPSSRIIGKYLQEIIDSQGLPMYYAVEYLASKLRIQVPKSRKLVELLEEHGYRATSTRFRKQALRTNAPVEFLKKCMLELSSKET